MHTITTYGILPHCFCGYKSICYRTPSSVSNAGKEILSLDIFFFMFGRRTEFTVIDSSGPTRLKTEVRVLKHWTPRLPELFPNLPQRPLLNCRKYCRQRIKMQMQLMMSCKMMLKTYLNTNFRMHLNALKASIA